MKHLKMHDEDNMEAVGEVRMVDIDGISDDSGDVTDEAP